jgi:hypothetical protein
METMKTKLVAVIGILAFLACASAALAVTTGNLKVKLVDNSGVTVNGTVVAKMGSTVKSCNTAAGTCTLSSLTTGAWTVTAMTAGGAKGGPVSKTVASGTTVTLTVQVK